MALRTVTIHKAGTRHHLFLGGDREMMMVLALWCAVLVYSLTWISCLYAVILWAVGSYALRRLAKYDPHLRKVYMRHRQYRKYYPARSTPFRTNNPKTGRSSSVPTTPFANPYRLFK